MRMFTIFLLFTLFALIGCTQPLNDRITLGGNSTPPTFRDMQSSTRTNQPTQLLGSISKPRTTWKTTRYIAPLDGVVHVYELVIPSTPGRTASPRIYGRFPTVNDVLNPQATPWLGDVLLAFAQFGRSFIGTPYAFVYMTVTGNLAKPGFSPHEIWKRTSSTTWSTGYPSAAPTAQENPPHDQ